MAQLDTLLADAEKTHRDMQAALARNDDKAVREIIGLRTKFAGLMAQMMGAIKADVRLAANTDLAAEFEQRFLDVRQQLAKHQAKFRMDLMEADLPAYRASVAEVGKAQDAFYSWAKGKLG
ncbi:MAG TPA: hypothetical protein VF418_14685 [Sphingomonadaceae bacterium]